MRLLLMISETLILVSATFLLMPEPALALLSGEVAESRLTGFEIGTLSRKSHELTLGIAAIGR